jgi:hypothetical protein
MFIASVELPHSDCTHRTHGTLYEALFNYFSLYLYLPCLTTNLIEDLYASVWLSRSVYIRVKATLSIEFSMLCPVDFLILCILQPS